MKEIVCKFCHCFGPTDAVWTIEVEAAPLGKAFAVCSCPCHVKDTNQEADYKRAFQTIFFPDIITVAKAPGATPH